MLIVSALSACLNSLTGLYGLPVHTVSFNTVYLFYLLMLGLIFTFIYILLVLPIPVSLSMTVSHARLFYPFTPYSANAY